MGVDGRAGAVALVAALLLVVTMGGYLAFAQEDDGTPTDGYGYSIAAPVLDERMDRHPGCLDISVQHTTAAYDFGSEGMVINLISPGDQVRVAKDQAADTFVTVLDIGELDLAGRGNFQFQVEFSVGPESYYRVDVHFDEWKTYVSYSLVDDDEKLVGYGDMLYDITERINLMVHVENGKLELGVNGIEDVQIMPGTTSYAPRFSSIRLGAGDEDPVLGKVYMKSFILGSGTSWNYYDGLKKTMVPDGKDFAFSIHMHADRASPEQFYSMANLSLQYGLRGTYDAWYVANSYFYSMNEPQYTAGLHALQNAGWDIGAHAVGYANLNRTQVIEGLESMQAEFGPIRTWSDHGERPQDLWKDGTDADSDYYVEDLVEGIGAAWMHQNKKAHSYYNDLNRDGMGYENPDHPDLPLFRVSKMQAYMMYSDPGREDDLDRFLRAWSADRSVMVCHDYFPYFFYVENETGTYSILEGQEDIGYFPWADLFPKRIFVGDEWKPLPGFARFLDWTSSYNVWFAPVREIYDRSQMVEEVRIEEDQHKVRITNPGDQRVTGLTLFTQGRPSYSLIGSGVEIIPSKGSNGAWHFIVDLEPGAELVLTKHFYEASGEGLGTQIPEGNDDSAIIAREEFRSLS